MDQDIFGFRPIRQSETSHWSRPRSFGFTEAMERVPLAESELLQASHHLPVLVETGRQKVQVVAGLCSRLLRHPLLDGEGRWSRPYMPLRLRCLPFSIALAPGEGEPKVTVLVSDALLSTQMQPEGTPILGEDGTATPPVVDFMRLLLRAESGSVALAAAAEQLILADLLLPVGPSPEGGTFWTVATERLAAVTAARAALLAKPNMLASQLLFCLLFSRRMLHANLGIDVHRIETQDAGTPQAVPAADPTNLSGLNFAMDESDLVPLDALAATGAESN
ncbi:SapC family protein [Roseixanthobacter liquoris]|uniref:SapC family protein n=1 Tax=Roseixanthobacter liquoris TaxID=3119921 RepID=UPI00372664C9